jgi:hypothetical protein
VINSSRLHLAVSLDPMRPIVVVCSRVLVVTGPHVVGHVQLSLILYVCSFYCTEQVAKLIWLEVRRMFAPGQLTDWPTVASDKLLDHGRRQISAVVVFELGSVWVRGVLKHIPLVSYCTSTNN